jgi:hypothetical protein
MISFVFGSSFLLFIPPPPTLKPSDPQPAWKGAERERKEVDLIVDVCVVPGVERLHASSVGCLLIYKPQQQQLKKGRVMCQSNISHISV